LEHQFLPGCSGTTPFDSVGKGCEVQLDVLISL